MLKSGNGLELPQSAQAPMPRAKKNKTTIKIEVLEVVLIIDSHHRPTSVGTVSKRFLKKLDFLPVSI